MPRVLVAVDRSEGSRRAAEFVDRFFAGMGVTITAVNVAQAPTEAVRPVPYGGLVAWPSARTTAKELEASDEARECERQEAQAVARTQAPADASAGVVFGDAVEAISRAAADQDADLIVVGSNDKGFLERLVSGSVSEELARKSPRPVLIVR